MEAVFLNIIRQIPFFTSLTEENHQSLADSITLHYFPEGHTIFKYGDRPDVMYVIRSGTVEIVNVENEPFKTLSDGEFFGEMALISNSPRNATVVTKSECDLFSLDKESLENIFQLNPEIAKKIQEVYLTRQEENNWNIP